MKVATQADLDDQLLGSSNDFSDLRRLTGRPQVADLLPHSVLGGPIERCRQRIISDGWIHPIRR